MTRPAGPRRFRATTPPAPCVALISALSLLCLITPSVTLALAPGIVSTLPERNELNVSISAQVSVTFDADMDAATINAATFVVHGTSSGPHAGTVSYDAPTRTATLEPAVIFSSGEVVSVVLTGDIHSAGGLPLDGYAWSFTVIAAPAQATFPERTDIVALGGHRCVAVADLDGDTDLDLITADGVSGGPSGTVMSVNLNHGDGTFDPAVYYPVGSVAWPVVASDLDGDGDLDIAVGSYNDSVVSVLLNDGTGIFVDDSQATVGYGSTSLVAADLDRDGDRDLVVGYFASSVVSVLMNNGDAAFGPQVNYTAGTPGSGTWSVHASDLDGDGDLDLAVTDVGADLVSVLMNNGDGTFADRTTYPTGDAPSSIFACDLDGDGDLDLAVANATSSDVSVLLNQGAGTYVSGGIYGVGPEPRSVVASDVDGDGDLDLATANYVFSGAGNGVSLLLNSGNGTFAAAVGHEVGDRPGSVVAGDLDGDGDLDLAVANRDDGVITLLMNEDVVAVSPTESLLDGYGIVAMSPTLASPLTVRFMLPGEMPVTAEVFSVAGERVTLLARGQTFGAGVHRMVWDGRSDRGSEVAPGVYYVRLTTPLGARSARAVLMR